MEKPDEATDRTIKPPRHAELARRVACAVASYNAGVSYATQEKRMMEDAFTIDPSWYVVADKLAKATTNAVSERLLSLFGDE